MYKIPKDDTMTIQDDRNRGNNKIPPPRESQQFDPDIAVALGIPAAAIHAIMTEWSQDRLCPFRHLHSGAYYLRISLQDMANEIPYLTRAMVKRVIADLIDEGLLVKDNFNDDVFDKTPWYLVIRKEVAGV